MNIFIYILYIEMNDILIWFLIFLIVLIMLGVYLSQNTPLNLNEKENILKKKIIENFNPSVSSSTQQTKGASQLYKWGLPQNQPPSPKKECEQPDTIPPFTPFPIPKSEECKKDPCDDEEKHAQYPSCYSSDITKNKDIDKYVLKSSIPPCPDVSKYATKNMIQSCPDINKYILKSEIPACPKVDMSQYILKSEIKSCPKCPVCPVCPICPVCPPAKKCKTIRNYKIIDHPDFKNYINKKDIDDYCEYGKKKSKEEIEREELKKKCKIIQEEMQEEMNNNIPNNQDDYDKMIDDRFNKKKVKPFSNPEGVYAGDSLFASI